MTNSILYRIEHVVRFYEVDASGRPFYSRVFEYFNFAYISYMASRGIDLAEVHDKKRWATPVVHAEADYVAGMRFGESVLVEILSASFGRSSMTIAYRIVSGADEAKIYCTGKTTSVFINVSEQASMPVPQVVRDAFLPKT